MSTRADVEASTELPDAILTLSEQMRFTWLSGHRAEASKMRRRLYRSIHRELNRDPHNVRLWCMLGDTYSRASRRMHCFRRALKIDPTDAEANAEIAELYAEAHDRRYARHFDRAITHCRGLDIEDSVIYAAMEAARIVGDDERREKARRLGSRRFPDCILFDRDTQNRKPARSGTR